MRTSRSPRATRAIRRQLSRQPAPDRTLIRHHIATRAVGSVRGIRDPRFYSLPFTIKPKLSDQFAGQKSHLGVRSDSRSIIYIKPKSRLPSSFSSSTASLYSLPTYMNFIFEQDQWTIIHHPDTMVTQSTSQAQAQSPTPVPASTAEPYGELTISTKSADQMVPKAPQSLRSAAKIR